MMIESIIDDNYDDDTDDDEICLPTFNWQIWLHGILCHCIIINVLCVGLYRNDAMHVYIISDVEHVRTCVS